jgi:hypothetical protein
MQIKRIHLLFLLLLISHELLGQDNLLINSDDTGHVYKRIERFSNQRKFTRLLFPLVFKPVNTTISKKSAVIRQQEMREPFSSFEGKVIRKIFISSYAPFGFSVNDSLKRPHTSAERIGNNLHVNSLPITIRNYLLIKRNEPFDSLLVMESERLLRKQRFIREVSLVPTLVSPDSVDILIRVQDVWSIVPDGSISTNSISVRIREDNFLGTGHQFSYLTNHDINSNNSAYDFGYIIPNINNSYVTASLGYVLALDRTYSKNIKVERNFYSPYARWAGGILFSQVFRKDSLILSESNRIFQKYRVNINDSWVGGAWPVKEGRSETERNTNIVAAGRWLRSKYLEKPSETVDSLNNYVDGSVYLACVGINSRKYIKDKFLFRFGVAEDIPIGRIYNISIGYDYKRGVKTGYFGAKTSWGDFYKIGYLAANLEYGTFFNKSGVQEGALIAGYTYFTNLFEIGNWRFRQFLKSDLVLGFNRSIDDRLSFNDYMDVSGFDTKLGSITRKFHLTIQTQSYAPWNLLGFRFGPFLTATLGMPGDESRGFSRSRTYSYLGVGVLIKNDFLNASYFQVSLSYYPIIPQFGRNVFRSNSFQSSDFGLQEFEMGKPAFVAYQ